MDTSNRVFEKYVADFSADFAGVQSSSWAMCTV